MSGQDLKDIPIGVIIRSKYSGRLYKTVDKPYLYTSGSEDYGESWWKVRAINMTTNKSENVRLDNFEVAP